MVQTRSQVRAAIAIWPQRQSHFFRLPQELRDMVYYHVFSTTELAFDEQDSRYKKKQAKKRENARNSRQLGLLRTCRRTRDDIADTWIGLVWFSFCKLWDLLRIMTAVPPDKLSKIRHLRILCPRLTYCEGDDNPRDFDCALDAVFGILPGLRLDKLVVHSLTYHKHADAYIDCHILHEMITNPHGWKELHYICSNSLVLADSGIWLAPGWPGTAPEYWETLLRLRDAPDSNASVTVFRPARGDAVSRVVRSAPTSHAKCELLAERLAKEANRKFTVPRNRRMNWLDWGWTVKNEKIRTPNDGKRYAWVDTSTNWCPFSGDFYLNESVEFEYRTPDGVQPSVYRGVREEFLRSPEERWKGMHIVVKRGSGADYTAKARSHEIAVPRDPEDQNHQTWEQFRHTVKNRRRL